MIRYVRLKPGIHIQELGLCQFSVPEWSFAVQSGLLVLRRGDEVYSIPLTDCAIMRDCPAAPPKKREVPQ